MPERIYRLAQGCNQKEKLKTENKFPRTLFRRSDRTLSHNIDMLVLEYLLRRLSDSQPYVKSLLGAKCSGVETTTLQVCKLKVIIVTRKAKSRLKFHQDPTE